MNINNKTSPYEAKNVAATNKIQTSAECPFGHDLKLGNLIFYLLKIFLSIYFFIQNYMFFLNIFLFR